MIDKLLQYFTLDNIRRLIEVLGGRRFVLTLIAGGGTWVLAWYAKISPEVYRDVSLGTVGIYIAGNTFQKTRVPPPKE
jgi:hypothetical protein